MAGKSLFISYEITSGEHFLKLNCLAYSIIIHSHFSILYSAALYLIILQM